MTPCAWWLCGHPLAGHTDARGCTVARCLCYYTAQEASHPMRVAPLAVVAWRNLYDGGDTKRAGDDPRRGARGMKYRTICADPPWCYRNAAARKSGAVLQYPVMPVEDIAALDVVRHSFFDAHLWLWTTNLFMEQAHWVLRSWGFEPVTILTWCKPGPGVGNYLRNNTEHCILGSRGFPKVPEHKPLSSWYTWPRGEHSRKPEAFYDIVEQVSPGPYLELFARTQRLGWDSYGLECLNHVEMGPTEERDDP